MFMGDSTCSQLALVTGMTGQDRYYLASRLANHGYRVLEQAAHLNVVVSLV